MSSIFKNSAEIRMILKMPGETGGQFMTVNHLPIEAFDFDDAPNLLFEYLKSDLYKLLQGVVEIKREANFIAKDALVKAQLKQTGGGDE